MSLLREQQPDAPVWLLALSLLREQQPDAPVCMFVGKHPAYTDSVKYIKGCVYVDDQLEVDFESHLAIINLMKIAVLKVFKELKVETDLQEGPPNIWVGFCVQRNLASACHATSEPQLCVLP